MTEARAARWEDDLVELTRWVLRKEDLRYRFLYAPTPADLATTTGLGRALETSIVLELYRSAISMGYVQGHTIDYERPYPSTSKGNPKRTDLAFRNEGAKRWSFLEVKRYGKKAVQKDIEKLQEFCRHSRRWMLVYRIQPLGSAQRLSKLLRKHFKKRIDIHTCVRLNSSVNGDSRATIEFAVFKVKKRRAQRG